MKIEFMIMGQPPKHTAQGSSTVLKNFKTGKYFIGKKANSNAVQDKNYLLAMLIPHRHKTPLQGALKCEIELFYSWRKSETKKNIAKGEMSLKHKDWYSKKENKEKFLMWIDNGLKTKLKKYGTLAVNTREKCSWKAGWREIGGKRKYFRSQWEANYARYLEWLKQHNQIKEWQHESKTFWFENIKRGCRSYLPDFEITNNDDSIEYHEVKGWYDDRSKTKVKRMAKYYPDVKLIIIFQKQYNEIRRKVSMLIKDWE